MSVAAVYAEDGKSHAPHFLYRQAARYPAAWDTPVLADGLKRIICVLKPYFLTACTEKNRFFAVRPVERGHFIRKKNRLFAVRPVERGHFIRKKKAAFRCETRRERSFHTEKKQAFRCETRRERSFHTDKNRAFRPEARIGNFFCMAGLHGSKGRKGRLQHFDRKSVGRLSGYCSDRSAHLLRRPYKNVQEGSIRPIAKRLEWPDAITVLPKAEQ